ncbi:transcription termination factor NusA [Carboxydochorda subterranea]|uniref:Transcription termination/antitermination protein NusA n=1 Tax=Carboxydichorda subterranea TaxID=3109565 RepID=A0ABZ1C0K1_9FIRM|nr:transcription termination factor NusA [Limnochorda sp. L945t]WRP18479.1 transcription termination factor NusA [Limnochorda sp. L945t]
MNLELMGALNELEKERGISREVLLKAIEDAIESAFRKSSQPHQNLRVDFDDRSGRVRVFARKAVAEKVTDPSTEISLEEAQRINPRFEVDDVVEVELTLPDLGRIAAQTAKQVVVQRIREAERSRVYEEYHSREGDILTGIVRRIEHRNVYVDLGRAEGVMPPSEQVATERYTPGTRMKFYLAEVSKTAKGPQLVLSRSHPGLVRRLFELEVPEIHDGVVEIRAHAREAGHRSKIAVWSTDRNVDPVGACVGPRGARVQQVVKELRQEKVDVIAWDPDPEVFLANALQPARVLKVYLDPTDRSAKVIVPEKELSLAIGKEGQNARLAARLTGWRIDIRSEAQWAEVQQEFEEKRRQWMQARPEAAGAGAARVGREEQPATAGAAATQAPPAERPAAQPAAGAAPARTETPAQSEQVPVPAVPVAEPSRAPLEVPVDAGPAVQAEEEEIPIEPEPVKPVEEEEQQLKQKGAGKVRRIKGVRRFERRHLEEELEEAESLPTLFSSEEEGEPEAAPAPEEPAVQRQEAARRDTLAVPLFAVAKRVLESPATREAKADGKTEAKADGKTEAKAKAAPAQAGEERERPEAPPQPQAAASGAPADAATTKAAPAPTAAPAAAAAAAPRPAAQRRAEERAREAVEDADKKPKKVLRSLSELSLEDFGFQRQGPKRKGR